MRKEDPIYFRRNILAAEKNLLSRCCKPALISTRLFVIR